MLMMQNLQRKALGILYTSDYEGVSMIKLNKTQEAALNIMQADARYLYTIIDIYKHAPNVQSNYTCMSLPYIGLFVDGAEQWCKKVGMNAPTFTPEEKAYYNTIIYVVLLIKLTTLKG